MKFKDKEIIGYEIEVEEVYGVDDYCAYFVYAKCEDGYLLNDAELEGLTDDYPDTIYEYVQDHLIGQADFLYD